ncbi:DUF4870 domain-containing protein [Acidithiobacillus sulfuriphilus]|uniref:DUF4870 domain-containing protein n=2 Tax=Acidithiobacillus sulfuriphilus TaxID=1867749 RepID=A0A3M8QU31_9PROT|nr:DUF4870 domain-containing protein [Acidithiobacillus sulfuriphilus]RNF59726.1 DUF4870 domain-containing protein [Acidithiobacillus sulfuriphilus]
MSTEIESAQPSSEDRNIAVLTHLGGIFFGFIPSLIVWLIKKDSSNAAWLSAQAREALNFQITMFLGYVIAWALTILLIGYLFFAFVAIINFIFCVLVAVKVSQGSDYRYPFSLHLIN